MKIQSLFFLALVLLGSPHLSAQQDNVKLNSKWQVSIQAGIQAAKYHNPYYFDLICIEGCTPVGLDWRRTTTVDLGIQYMVADHQWLRLGLAYSEYGFKDDILENFSIEGPWSRDIRFAFFAVEGAYGWEFFRWKRLGLFTEQGLRLETPTDDELDELKNVNWSYSGRLGALYHLNPKISLQFNGNFKTALARYNQHEVGFDDYNNYFPFAIGGEIGVVLQM